MRDLITKDFFSHFWLCLLNLCIVTPEIQLSANIPEISSCQAVGLFFLPFRCVINFISVNVVMVILMRLFPIFPIKVPTGGVMAVL